jgi:hypothetical protein
LCWGLYGRNKISDAGGTNKSLCRLFGIELDFKTVVYKFHISRIDVLGILEILLDIVGVFITLILVTPRWSLSGNKLI